MMLSFAKAPAASHLKECHLNFLCGKMTWMLGSGEALGAAAPFDLPRPRPPSPPSRGPPAPLSPPPPVPVACADTAEELVEDVEELDEEQEPLEQADPFAPPAH